MLKDSTSAAEASRASIAAGADEVRQPREWLSYLTRHMDVPLPLSGSGNAQALDLAYREYCAMLAAGDNPDADAFCAQYPSLQHSLAELIRCHHFANENPELVAEPEDIVWPRAGELFLGFRLLSQLGQGGFARVFLATEPALGNRKVAVKVSRGNSTEADTQGRIYHPNVVPVYSEKRDDASKLTAVCMPYLGSATLNDLLDAVKAVMPKSSTAIIDNVRGGEPIDLPNAGEQPHSPLQVSSYVDGVCLIAAQLADALHFIHANHIYHRDLKPANILMTPDGRPMVLDFNLSADMAKPGTGIGGTLPYMPPEQLLACTNSLHPGTAVVSAQSDLYSFGVMLFELLTGHHPFGPLSLQDSLAHTRLVLLERQKQGPISVRRLNPEVPPELARLVEQCLAYQPADRPRHAGEMAAALRRGLSPWRRGRRFLARHSRLAAAVACVVVAFCGTAAALWSQQESNAAMHWRLGMASLGQGQYPAAVEHFDTVLKDEPRRVDALLARAHAYMKWGESEHHMYNKALADLRSAQRIQPGGAVSSAVGYCMLRVGMSTEEARAELQNAIDAGYGTAETFNNLAFCYMYLPNLQEADKSLDKAMQANPGMRAALHNRGRLRWMQVLAIGSYEPPTKQTRKRPNAEQIELQCVALLEEGKAAYSQALTCAGPASGELYFDAAQLWGVASNYFPNDIAKTLQFLDQAVSLGADQSAIKNGQAFMHLRANQQFIEIWQRPVGVRQVPATIRLVDPLTD
jgi:serine/threonine protein kinase/Tfp pilus assembly protein PilF